MTVALRTLRPGTRFALPLAASTKRGIIILVNECRAVVRLDKPEEDSSGGRSQYVSWSPETQVEVG